MMAVIRLRHVGRAKRPMRPLEPAGKHRRHAIRMGRVQHPHCHQRVWAVKPVRTGQPVRAARPPGARRPIQPRVIRAALIADLKLIEVKRHQIHIRLPLYPVQPMRLVRAAQNVLCNHPRLHRTGIDARRVFHRVPCSGLDHLVLNPDQIKAERGIHPRRAVQRRLAQRRHRITCRCRVECLARFHIGILIKSALDEPDKAFPKPHIVPQEIDHRFLVGAVTRHPIAQVEPLAAHGRIGQPCRARRIQLTRRPRAAALHHTVFTQREAPVLGQIDSDLLRRRVLQMVAHAVHFQHKPAID